MTTSTVRPGMRAVTGHASPYTPIAVINGTPIYALRGGRSGGGIKIVAGDADGADDDDLLEDADDDDEPDDEQDDLPASMRGKASRKKTVARRTAVEDDEDDDDEQDEDEDDTPGAIRRMEEAVSKANRTAAKYRRAGKTMERLGIDDLPTWLTERGIDPDTGQPYGSDVVDPDETPGDDGALYDDEPLDRDERRRSRADEAKRDKETVRAIRTAEKRAEARAEAKFVPILAQQAATTALREAGFKGKPERLERLLRMIDPSDLDIHVGDDEFEIEGLDEQVAALVDDFPELFAAPVEAKTTRTGGTRTRPARRATGARDVDGGERGRTAKKPGGWMDQVAARWDRDGR